MITVANRIYVHPTFAKDFEERFRQRAGEVDKMAGFVANYVLRPQTEDDPYVVLTFWESQAAFEAWVNSDAFRKGHARSSTLPQEAFTRPNKLEIHEVVTATR
jgi:heme-degrading monooxygenase HmoA